MKHVAKIVLAIVVLLAFTSPAPAAPMNAMQLKGRIFCVQGEGFLPSAHDVKIYEAGELGNIPIVTATPNAWTGEYGMLIPSLPSNRRVVHFIYNSDLYQTFVLEPNENSLVLFDVSANCGEKYMPLFMPYIERGR